MSKIKIRNRYRKCEISLDDACWQLMESFDMFRGEALGYLMS